MGARLMGQVGMAFLIVAPKWLPTVAALGGPLQLPGWASHAHIIHLDLIRAPMSRMGCIYTPSFPWGPRQPGTLTLYIKIVHHLDWYFGSPTKTRLESSMTKFKPYVINH